MGKITPITVAYGDGIGPEITHCVLDILKEAQAPVRIETVDIGGSLYNKNYSCGIDPASWEVICRNPVLLKAPITTPLKGGYKSINVTIRKMLDLYANIRPVKNYSPIIKESNPNINLTVFRENSEDLYAGIEHRQTSNIYQSLKLVSQNGSRRIIQAAFDYASSMGLKKISCFTKDNIMKLSDGIFHSEFEKIAKNFPDIEPEHMIIDIAAAMVATKPEKFEVIVTSNLYGDIVSDIAAAVSGSVGLAGSANIGNKFAMFEAVHGSAPDIAGKNIANPSGLLNAATMMLVHLGYSEHANLIENAWKKTLEDGMHTADIYDKSTSKERLGTKEFAKEVIARLGQRPKILKQANYTPIKKDNIKNIPDSLKSSDISEKKLIGIDIFTGQNEKNAESLASKIKKINIRKISKGKLALHTISSMGLKLWPSSEIAGLDISHAVDDHWCMRFVATDTKTELSLSDLSSLISHLISNDIDFIKCENLYNFGDYRGYSLSQGE